MHGEFVGLRVGVMSCKIAQEFQCRIAPWLAATLMNQPAKRATDFVSESKTGKPFNNGLNQGQRGGLPSDCSFFGWRCFRERSEDCSDIIGLDIRWKLQSEFCHSFWRPVSHGAKVA